MLRRFILSRRSLAELTEARAEDQTITELACGLPVYLSRRGEVSIDSRGYRTHVGKFWAQCGETHCVVDTTEEYEARAEELLPAERDRAARRRGRQDAEAVDTARQELRQQLEYATVRDMRTLDTASQIVYAETQRLLGQRAEVDPHTGRLTDRRRAEIENPINQRLASMGLRYIVDDSDFATTGQIRGSLVPVVEDRNRAVNLSTSINVSVPEGATARQVADALNSRHGSYAAATVHQTVAYRAQENYSNLFAGTPLTVQNLQRVYAQFCADTAEGSRLDDVATSQYNLHRAEGESDTSLRRRCLAALHPTATSTYHSFSVVEVDTELWSDHSTLSRLLDGVTTLTRSSADDIVKQLSGRGILCIGVDEDVETTLRWVRRCTENDIVLAVKQ